MNATPQQTRIVDWLTGLQYTARPIAVRIGETTREAVAYSCDDHGERLYVIGARPKMRRPNKTVFETADGAVWYVICWIDDVPERYAHAHPVGPNFVLAPWDYPHPIDECERKPYDRTPLNVNAL